VHTAVVTGATSRNADSTALYHEGGTGEKPMKKLILVAGLVSGCQAAAPGLGDAGVDTGGTTDGSQLGSTQLGTTVETQDPCQWQGPTDVGMEEATAAGYTGAELLDVALGMRELALEWANGDLTTLALEVVDPAPVAQLYTVPEGCDTGSFLTIEAFLELNTADAALRERVPVTVIPQQDMDHLHMAVVLDTLEGELDLGLFAPGGEVPAPTELAFKFQPDEACGWITGQDIDSPLPAYEIGWFWTEATASEFGTGRDHFIGCYHGNG
jgi:hypothetical protein